MANLARIEPEAARPVIVTAVPANDTARPDFSPLEWSVVRLARHDALSTLRAPNRWDRFVNWLLGRRGSQGLANERLEALRKAAVLSWHFGFSIPGSDVADFLSAGFTPDQYELMVLSIANARTTPSRKLS